MAFAPVTFIVNVQCSFLMMVHFGVIIVMTAAGTMVPIVSAFIATI